MAPTPIRVDPLSGPLTRVRDRSERAQVRGKSAGVRGDRSAKKRREGPSRPRPAPIRIRPAADWEVTMNWGGWAWAGGTQRPAPLTALGVPGGAPQ